MAHLRSYEFWPEEPDGVEVRAGPEAEAARLPRARPLTPASREEPSDPSPTRNEESLHTGKNQGQTLHCQYCCSGWRGGNAEFEGNELTYTITAMQLPTAAQAG